MFKKNFNIIILYILNKINTFIHKLSNINNISQNIHKYYVDIN